MPVLTAVDLDGVCVLVCVAGVRIACCVANERVFGQKVLTERRLLALSALILIKDPTFIVAYN